MLASFIHRRSIKAQSRQIPQKLAARINFVVLHIGLQNWVKSINIAIIFHHLVDSIVYNAQVLYKRRCDCFSVPNPKQKDLLGSKISVTVAFTKNSMISFTKPKEDHSWNYNLVTLQQEPIWEQRADHKMTQGEIILINNWK